jgi:salicylate hydroxylase
MSHSGRFVNSAFATRSQFGFPSRTGFLIVGGGIGGLTAALALARAGQRVHVLEAAPEFGEIGAGIQLAPNAVRMLGRLGMLPGVAKCCVFPRSLVFMDALSGTAVASVDLGQPFLERFEAPYVVLHRSDLHALLLDACLRDDRITLETDRQVTAVHERDDGALVRCANGAQYACDALVGADGLKSVVRGLISDDEPVASGYVAYRGTISIDDAQLHEHRDSMVYWWGPGLHLVQYAVRGGRLYNQVGVFRCDIAGSDGSDFGRELDATFDRCCEPVRRGAALLDRGMRWPMLDRDPIDNWTRNRITLLGDAAHPMLQYIAQGGCQAIEDALCLADMVVSHDDVAAAFLAYQTERIPRTGRVQLSARAFGELGHLDGIGVALRNQVLSQHSPTDYQPLDWLYNAGSRPVVASAGPV